MTIEVYFRDLSEEKQAEILAAYGDNNNWDVYPLIVLEIEED